MKTYDLLQILRFEGWGRSYKGVDLFQIIGDNLKKIANDEILWFRYRFEIRWLGWRLWKGSSILITDSDLIN